MRFKDFDLDYLEMLKKRKKMKNGCVFTLLLEKLKQLGLFGPLTR